MVGTTGCVVEVWVRRSSLHCGADIEGSGIPRRKRVKPSGKLGRLEQGCSVGLSASKSLIPFNLITQKSNRLEFSDKYTYYAM